MEPREIAAFEMFVFNIGDKVVHRTGDESYIVVARQLVEYPYGFARLYTVQNNAAQKVFEELVLGIA